MIPNKTQAKRTAAEEEEEEGEFVLKSKRLRVINCIIHSKREPAGDSDDSDDDDDINVVIGDIKSGGTAYNAKGQDKQKLPGSKFNMEEFETVGSINGQPAYEFAIESIEDKPWRKPGADITDYFSE